MTQKHNTLTEPEQTVYKYYYHANNKTHYTILTLITITLTLIITTQQNTEPGTTTPTQNIILGIGGALAGLTYWYTRTQKQAAQHAYQETTPTTLTNTITKIAKQTPLQLQYINNIITLCLSLTGMLTTFNPQNTILLTITLTLTITTLTLTIITHITHHNTTKHWTTTPPQQ